MMAKCRNLHKTSMPLGLGLGCIKFFILSDGYGEFIIYELSFLVAPIFASNKAR